MAVAPARSMDGRHELYKTPSTIGDSDGRAHIEIVGKLLRDTAGCHGLHEHRKPSSYGQFHSNTWGCEHKFERANAVWHTNSLVTITIVISHCKKHIW